ncbi:MAG: 6-phosphofructokinase [Anaerolineae bacterium]|nr:6-phosphofructokinase [Anaerolineae bacterium]MCB9132018.1 6-phosphofructokinase [Anaerolineales bacterium]MCB0241402.1 6-phosphofructokinase [Anaerolineae bacterium]MCB0241785.1 6-phosphofructokinase [Anaerolineae bacterium]MCB0251436.1 6-phosphofructokinase [Anaerolineae bacterium]
MNSRRRQKQIERIGVLTAGGDCPGLNAVIRAVVKSAIAVHGWDVIGIKDGFEGLITDNPRSTIPLTLHSVHGILARGGTILGAASRTNPFLYTKRLKGDRILIDVTPRVMERIDELGLNAIVVIGGDGTMRIARELHDMGAPLVGVPKTIDNDVDGTEYSFGFDTAVNIATEAIDRLRTTAESHHRVMIVEVMGRKAGWIALHAGVGGGADVVLIPEQPFDVTVVRERLERCFEDVQHSAIIVVAEGARPKDGQEIYRAGIAGQETPRLGGIGFYLAERLMAEQESLPEDAGYEIRATVLGHVQRGGTPSGADRVLATRFGAAAVRLIAEGRTGRMVALRGEYLTDLPLSRVARMPRTVPLDSDIVQTARELGISLG